MTAQDDSRRSLPLHCDGWDFFGSTGVGQLRACDSLKSELGLRPVFHHKPERADAHLFISVLAYQFVQIIRRRLGEQQIHARWGRLRELLGQQVRVSAVFQRPDGHNLHVRKATRPEGEHLRICQVLGLDQQPGGVQKMIHCPPQLQRFAGL